MEIGYIDTRIIPSTHDQNIQNRSAELQGKLGHCLQTWSVFRQQECHRRYNSRQTEEHGAHGGFSCAATGHDEQPKLMKIALLRGTYSYMVWQRRRPSPYTVAENLRESQHEAIVSVE